MLATWAVATDAIDEDVARLNARGANLAAPIDGERRRPDGAVVRWRLAAPRELGPATPPFLIEHDPTAAEWTAPERAARATQTHPLGASVRLETLELDVPDIARTSGALFRTVGIGPFRPSLSGRRTRDAPIGQQTVRLRAAMGLVTVATWPVATIHLRAVPVDFTATPVEPRTVELWGVGSSSRREAGRGADLRVPPATWRQHRPGGDPHGARLLLLPEGRRPI